MEVSLLSLVVGGFYCALYFVGILDSAGYLRPLLLLLLCGCNHWHPCTCVLADLLAWFVLHSPEA